MHVFKPGLALGAVCVFLLLPYVPKRTHLRSARYRKNKRNIMLCNGLRVKLAKLDWPNFWPQLKLEMPNKIAANVRKWMYSHKRNRYEDHWLCIGTGVHMVWYYFDCTQPYYVCYYIRKNAYMVRWWCIDLFRKNDLNIGVYWITNSWYTLVNTGAKHARLQARCICGLERSFWIFLLGVIHINNSKWGSQRVHNYDFLMFFLMMQIQIII